VATLRGEVTGSANANNAARLATIWGDGVLVYDTDDDRLYVGDGETAGGNPLAEGGTTPIPGHPHLFQGDGATTVFTLPWTPLTASARVCRNGLQIERSPTPGDKDEFLIAGNKITFGAPPGTLDRLSVSAWTR
jgi:hypothetical protein